MRLWIWACREAISLVLLCHRLVETSPFHWLPMEILVIIIGMVLADLPAAGFKLLL